MTTKIIAHRGDTSNHPENTLSAFQAALEAGASAVELDAHFTADGQIIVHHDYYLGNPDNGKGRVHEKDLDYIRSLVIGENEHIPTLEEVFQTFGNNLDYEIELKGFGKALVPKVIALVKAYRLLENVEFTSPHSYTLTHIKELEPNLKTGKFVTLPPSWMDRELGQTLAINNALAGHINVIHCPVELIDKQFVQNAHHAGLLIHAADCDTPESLRAAMEAGVDQLSTNNLKQALRYI